MQCAGCAASIAAAVAGARDAAFQRFSPSALKSSALMIVAFAFKPPTESIRVSAHALYLATGRQ
jgi:hypothetical protein